MERIHDINAKRTTLSDKRDVLGESIYHAPPDLVILV